MPTTTPRQPDARPAPRAKPSGELRRRLGLPGAVLTGAGSILGTGAFVSIALCIGVAGPAVLPAVVIAALLALCNGLSSAQLAAAHPVSGGTYEYATRLIHPSAGFAAGWLFLVAKSASAATAALGVAAYVLRDAAELIRIGAALAVVAVAVGLVLAGVKRTAAANAVLLTLAIAALLAFGFVALPGLWGADENEPALANFPAFVSGFVAEAGAFAASPVPWRDALAAAALAFVAFTGYGRIATLGEEVINPAKTIPRAILITLGLAAGLYLLTAAALLSLPMRVLTGVLPSGSGVAAPLELAASALDRPGFAWVIAIGAVAAMFGVLLNLVLGLSRVALAMGRRVDLPPALARISASGNPAPAVLAVGGVIAALVFIGDVKATWSLSAFTVLAYYALTNLAALRLPEPDRLFSRAWAWAGLIACVALAFMLAPIYWAAGGLLVLLGFGVRWVVRAARGGG